MKTLIIFLAIVLPVAVLAQTTPVDKLFKKYANKEGFTTVNISGKMLQFASQIDTGENKSGEVLSGLTGIRILSVENSEVTGKVDFFKELEKDGFFDNKDYEVLMEVTEADEVVRFLARGSDYGKLSDLILVVGGEESALISIQGIIDPAHISKIAGAVDVDLGHLEEKKQEEHE